MLLIISMGFYINDNYGNLYFILIIAGLTFGLIGDSFLMFPKLHFSKGLISFLIGHLVYIAAFYFAAGSINIIVLTIAVIVGYVLIKQLLSIKSDFKNKAAVYGFILILMLGAAMNAFIFSSNYFILIGAVLFVLSDLVLAANKFINEFYPAHLIILATYFSAQTLLVISI